MFEYGTKLVLKPIKAIGEVSCVYHEDRDYRITFNGATFKIPETAFLAIFDEYKVEVINPEVLEQPIEEVKEVKKTKKTKKGGK
jgi:hypothetical protein